MKFSEIFKDDNAWNEKSVIGFIAFAVMVLVMLVDLVCNFFAVEFTVEPIVYNSFLYLVLGCFGISGAERIFAKSKKDEE